MSFSKGDLLKWRDKNAFDEGGIWMVTNVKPFIIRVVRHKHHSIHSVITGYHPRYFSLIRSSSSSPHALVINKIKEMDNRRKELGYAF